MWHVLEVVAALRRTGRAAEVVERDSGDAPFGEPQSELLVEAVQPAHVGQDHHADVGRLLRHGSERGVVVSVRGLEHEVLVRDGRAADDGDRR